MLQNVCLLGMISSSCSPPGEASISFAKWVNLCFWFFFLTAGTTVVVEGWISDLSTMSVCAFPDSKTLTVSVYLLSDPKTLLFL